MRGRERYAKGSAGLGAAFLTFAIIGWLAPWHEDPPVVRDCSPVSAADYPAARQTLIGQGYVPAADADYLTPPGCNR